MKIPEPQCPDPSLFFIGKNRRGQWIVLNQSGSRGGIFIDRTAALKFAMFENSNRPQAVVMVPGILDVDFGAVDVDGRSAANKPHSFSRRPAERYSLDAA